ncbi:Xylose isomerase-like TIM barrel [Stieleria bergensis]|uniref:Xylose isomerase-like TIM barrel n=1 Tax=Stieleria bergensis TaxID=2528025 RepID=A0A517SUH1_9BACT|nr:Xylose isomerase-like TIM barrel [Planctomycetes bacterium SV_7m_r]
MKRRHFLSGLSAATLATTAMGTTPLARAAETNAAPWLKLSLQQYSFRSMLTGKNPSLTTLDYPQFAVEKCGIKALEYFNGFFEDKSGETAFFQQVRQRCDDLGVENQLMLCRNKRGIDDADAGTRAAAAKDYIPWLEAAKTLGCHSIRVDCRSQGDADEVLKQAVDGLNQLCEIAKSYQLDIIIENHGNHSSNGAWLARLMKTANIDNLGTLPDFGNFRDYDRYQGVKETLPWARAVCAKIHAFTEDGQAKHTDFAKMIGIIKDSGFKGYIGIEYEGQNPTPLDGVLMAKRLIEQVLAATS